MEVNGGGLIVMIGENVRGLGKYESYGECWSYGTGTPSPFTYGISAGGGSINIFAKDSLEINKNSCNVTCESGRNQYLIGASGSISIGTIKTGIFMEL